MSNPSPHEPLELTPERLAIHRAWVRRYVEAVRQIWLDNGEDADSAEGLVALEHVRRSMSVPERPEWMTPGQAYAIVTCLDDPDPDEATLLDRRDALRTISALREDEQRTILAEIVGVTPGHIKHYRPHGLSIDATATAVYRHYDSNGVLLYVGVANDPAQRAMAHRGRSKWYRLVDRTEVVWYTDRRLAFDAEANAIRTELPLFNVQQARPEAMAAGIRYLLDLLD